MSVTTEEILTLSNSFIVWLKNNVTTVVSAVNHTYVNEVVGVRQKIINDVNTLAIKQGKDAAYGGMTGSYVEIIKIHNPFILPGDVEKIITLLKSTNRIHQLGPGKGKALILLSPTQITGTEYVEKSISTNDALGLSKALKDAVASIVNDNKTLRAQVEDLQKQRNEQDKKIKALNAEVSLKYKTSWT